jgi:hypothetical protein
MRRLVFLLSLAACAPPSVFVTDVRPLADGSISMTSCTSMHDLIGRHVLGECHTVRRRPLTVDP